MQPRFPVVGRRMTGFSQLKIWKQKTCVVSIFKNPTSWKIYFQRKKIPNCVGSLVDRENASRLDTCPGFPLVWKRWRGNYLQQKVKGKVTQKQSSYWTYFSLKLRFFKTQLHESLSIYWPKERKVYRNMVDGKNALVWTASPCFPLVVVW